MKQIKRISAIFLAVLVIGGEAGLRMFSPELGADIFKKPHPVTGFSYDDEIGYELTPFAAYRRKISDQAWVPERVNSEGFRGPEYEIPKPENTFRILVLGDSVAEEVVLIDDYTWERVLERGLREKADRSGSARNYEVINAGVRGYISRQALLRLKRRGLKYSPDIVIILVGWDDMIFSSMPDWKPGTDLSKFQEAKKKEEASSPKPWTEKSKTWRRFRRSLYRISYIARLIREGRNTIMWRNHEQRLVDKHSIDSGLRFNQQAFGLYFENLEQIYQVTKTGGARMALVTWPIIFSPELLEDREINRKSVLCYRFFPLSVREFWDWYTRYLNAQREFAKSHPDMILIDAAEAFSKKNKSQRLELFLDLLHFTAKGSREAARIILKELNEQGQL